MAFIVSDLVRDGLRVTQELESAGLPRLVDPRLFRVGEVLAANEKMNAALRIDLVLIREPRFLLIILQFVKFLKDSSYTSEGTTINASAVGTSRSAVTLSKRFMAFEPACARLVLPETFYLFSSGRLAFVSSQIKCEMPSAIDSRCSSAEKLQTITMQWDYCRVVL
jgi:hypothetical protein